MRNALGGCIAQKSFIEEEEEEEVLPGRRRLTY
jgi:hypothetical protein